MLDLARTRDFARFTSRSSRGAARLWAITSGGAGAAVQQSVTNDSRWPSSGGEGAATEVRAECFSGHRGSNFRDVLISSQSFPSDDMAYATQTEARLGSEQTSAVLATNLEQPANSAVSSPSRRSNLIVRLADFIDANAPAILAEWEAFAATLLPAASGLDTAALRDHAEQILQAVSKDLRKH